MDGGDCWDCFDGFCGGGGVEGKSLRAIHEVMDPSSRPDLEAGLGGGSCFGLGLSRGSIQVFHVGVWEVRKGGGLAGRVEEEKVEEGLKTSSEPRESLGSGGMTEAGVSDCSSSISLLCMNMDNQIIYYPKMLDKNISYATLPYLIRDTVVLNFFLNKLL